MARDLNPKSSFSLSLFSYLFRWKNHEQSKSHKERIALLQQDLLLDDEVSEEFPSDIQENTQLQQDASVTEDSQENAVHVEEEAKSEEESDLKREKWAEKRKKKKQKKKIPNAILNQSESDQETLPSDETTTELTSVVANEVYQCLCKSELW